MSSDRVRCSLFRTFSSARAMAAGSEMVKVDVVILMLEARRLSRTPLTNAVAMCEVHLREQVVAARPDGERVRLGVLPLEAIGALEVRLRPRRRPAQQRRRLEAPGRSLALHPRGTLRLVIGRGGRGERRRRSPRGLDLVAEADGDLEAIAAERLRRSLAEDQSLFPEGRDDHPEERLRRGLPARQEEAILGTRERHVEEPARLLLADAPVAFLGGDAIAVSEPPAAEADHAGQPLAQDRPFGRVARPAVEVGDDHDRELEPLRLVDAEDADGVELLVGRRRLPLLFALAEAPAVLRDARVE